MHQRMASGGKDHHEASYSDHHVEKWNRGKASENWWETIEQTHGHVGPWNVLGWRIGQAGLEEFGTTWGRHDLDIVCYVPMRTPYTCMVDGLIIGTGNCMGRLDIRMAEVMSLELVYVAVQRKDGDGDVVVMRPKTEYLRRIDKPSVDKLEELARECKDMEQEDLFEIERIKR